MTIARTLGKQWVLGCAAAMMFSGAATAEFTFNPYASGQYLYDSNIYKFSRQVADATATADPADRSQRYRAGLEAGYKGAQQKLHATLEGRHIRFDRFRHLDHNEYTFDTGFEGTILGNTRGLLNFRDESRLASFEDRRSTELIIERDQVGRGSLNFAVTPAWHLVAGTRYRNLHTPLPAAPALTPPVPGAQAAPARVAMPDFRLHESAHHIGVQYGIESREHPGVEAPLVFGVILESQAVSFSGFILAPPPSSPPPPSDGVIPETFDGYRLLALEATATYAISELAQFDGKLGATQYHSAQDDASPELTGAIGYTRALSGVTEVNLNIFQRIAPSVATADAATDSGASFGVRWQPILDLLVQANYSWTKSAFQGASGIAPDNTGRSDTTQISSISIAYPLFRRYTLRLFGNHADRSSSLMFNNYIDQSAGVELSFHWRPLE